jgi:hypothetical protein
VLAALLLTIASIAPAKLSGLRDYDNAGSGPFLQQSKSMLRRVIVFLAFSHQ